MGDLMSWCSQLEPKGMSVDQAVAMILAELRRAERKFPTWPTDPVHASAIVAEEAGELVRAANQATFESGDPQDMLTEAVQTAAMGLRFVLMFGKMQTRPSPQESR